ncbi:cysteine/serine endopeptidase inhibitor [Actinoplanes sp. NPDC049548]|uniref:cysteine/serine endopeptidase inhibitor n=1 Tax=Actinoplanes sp. NPDC049548 TaxID=3155152 RepID=UPI003413C0DB
MRLRRPRSRVTTAVVGGLAATVTVVVAMVTTSASAATIPVGKSQTGKATYYDDAGYGACGTEIKAATQSFVAVSHTWWTSANPNKDPLCKGIAVAVTYKGKTVTVPVRDKCPGCDATHLDLSKPVFEKFEPLGVGVLRGVTWKFVNADGSSAETGPTTTVAPTRTKKPKATPTSVAPTTSAPASGKPWPSRALTFRRR